MYGMNNYQSLGLFSLIYFFVSVPSFNHLKTISYNGSESSVAAMAVMDELFVIREDANSIEVYDLERFFLNRIIFPIKFDNSGISYNIQHCTAIDIDCCVKSRLLYAVERKYTGYEWFNAVWILDTSCRLADNNLFCDLTNDCNIYTNRNQRGCITIGWPLDEDASGISVNASTENILITFRDNPAATLYSSTGALLRHFDFGSVNISRVHSVKILNTSQVLVTYDSSYVGLVSMKDNHHLELSNLYNGEGCFDSVVVDTRGNILVIDSSSCVIQILSHLLEPIGKIELKDVGVTFPNKLHLDEPSLYVSSQNQICLFTCTSY